jgi:branched-chain amino acid transport system ATP-binding protein
VTRVISEVGARITDSVAGFGRFTLFAASATGGVVTRPRAYGYILENGRVVLDGTATELRENTDVKEFYLGLSEGKRVNFRDVKHYRRRKRWLT